MGIGYDKGWFRPLGAKNLMAVFPIKIVFYIEVVGLKARYKCIIFTFARNLTNN